MAKKEESTVKVVMARAVIVNADDGTQHHLAAGVNIIPASLAEHYLVQEFALDIPDAPINLAEPQLIADLEAANSLLVEKGKKIADLEALVQLKDDAIKVMRAELEVLGKEVNDLKGQITKPKAETAKDAK